MRAMRRKDRQLSEEETLEILKNGQYGVLSTAGRDGSPYGVPLSYVWLEGSLYFHSALNGHKLDNLRENNRVSFTVAGDTQPVYDRNFTTYFESAIVFGIVEEITDARERHDALYALARKYLPEHMENAERDIHASDKRTLVCAVRVEGISGKAKKPPR